MNTASLELPRARHLENPKAQDPNPKSQSQIPIEATSRESGQAAPQGTGTSPSVTPLHLHPRDQLLTHEESRHMSAEWFRHGSLGRSASIPFDEPLKECVCPLPCVLVARIFRIEVESLHGRDAVDALLTDLLAVRVQPHIWFTKSSRMGFSDQTKMRYGFLRRGGSPVGLDGFLSRC
jgi:hypothetical protein